MHSSQDNLNGVYAIIKQSKKRINKIVYYMKHKDFIIKSEVNLMSEVIFTVDSDGCVIDSMTYKHELFMGPLAANHFKVKDRISFLKNWNSINLFSRARGVNRFKGLVKTLQSVAYDEMNVENLYRWTEDSDVLSPETLTREIEKYGTEDLQTALDWTLAVNQGFAEDNEHDDVFDGAAEGLLKMTELGNVYVVSTANKEAITDEWSRYELLEYVDGIFGQDSGRKEDTIAHFIKEGTDPQKIMMIGDSPGDLAAAEINKSWFFPILVGQEKESWDDFVNHVADKFATGEYTQADQDAYKKKFWDNLDR